MNGDNELKSIALSLCWVSLSAIAFGIYQYGIGLFKMPGIDRK